MRPRNLTNKHRKGRSEERRLAELRYRSLEAGWALEKLYGSAAYWSGSYKKGEGRRLWEGLKKGPDGSPTVRYGVSVGLYEDYKTSAAARKVRA